MKSNIKTLLVCLIIPVALAGCASRTCVRYETSYQNICQGGDMRRCKLQSVMNCVSWVEDPKKVPLRPVAVPDGYPPNTIFPGAGLKDCNITQDVADTCKRFSLSLAKQVSNNYYGNNEGNIVFNNEQQVEILSRRYILFIFDGRHFDSMSGELLSSSREFRPFQGQTDRGIGINSSPQDVITKYGKPDYQTDKHSRHYNFGISYDIGISFEFLNINNKPVLKWIKVKPIVVKPKDGY